VIVPVLLVLAWACYRHHPGVRARQQLRKAARHGDQMRQDIRTATEQAKAKMTRITRDYRNRT
jgi:hypothetical protein